MTSAIGMAKGMNGVAHTWSQSEIDELRDGLGSIGYASAAEAIHQLQQQLAAAREALQAAEANAARYLWMRGWFLRDGSRSEITPVGHIYRYSHSEIDTEIDATLQRDRQP